MYSRYAQKCSVTSSSHYTKLERPWEITCTLLMKKFFLLLERLSIVIAISDIVIPTGLSANCSLEISLLFPDTYRFSLTKPITLYISPYIYFCTQTTWALLIRATSHDHSRPSTTRHNFVTTTHNQVYFRNQHPWPAIILLLPSSISHNFNYTSHQCPQLAIISSPPLTTTYIVTSHQQQ